MACERRLIDANELLNTLRKRILLAYPNEFYGLMLAHDLIDNAPTVDAAEVVHGRLNDPYIDEYYGEFSDCLECGTDNILPCYYCRKCGAKMDGGARDGL